MARNFMSELDSLFKLDGDLDSLDKNLHEKYASVPAPIKHAPTDPVQEASRHLPDPGT